MNLRLQELVFAGASRITDLSPALGARVLDSVLRPAFGSRTLSTILRRRNRQVMRRVRRFRRFLVIPDIHIGDAVMTQSSVTAFRDFFPDAEIDYVVNRAAAPIIEGNPDATRVMPLFSAGLFPSTEDLTALREIIRNGDYDLCIGFSPFMEEQALVQRGQPFLNFVTHGATLIRNEASTAAVNHFSYQGFHFLRELLSTVARPNRDTPFQGVRTTYRDEAVAQALGFMAEVRLIPGAPVIMMNPDGASRFTVMPFETQAVLLERLAQDTSPDTTILLGAGHTLAGLGGRLRDVIPPQLRSKLHIIPPSLPLEAYAALIDAADVFLTGDTGPMHIAAARRYSRSGKHQFRNRTAVLSWFGATPSRMSGYDSHQPGYLPANQDAPSWCYVAGSPCRNITCVNKMFKTCRTVRCFERVDVNALVTLVVSHIGHRAAP